MILQNRDIEILACILRYKYVFSTHIKEIFFKGKTDSAMSQVLSRLHKLKFISKDHIPRTSNIKLGSLLYLTDRGANFLSQEWELPLEAIGYKKVFYPIQSINHCYHKKREIDFWMALDKELEHSHLILKEIATDGEREIRNGKQVVKTNIQTQSGATLVPDLYFILQNQRTSGERLYFVEIDTGKETIGGKFRAPSQNSLIYKYQAYEKILKSGNWKKSIETTATAFQVLTVTEKQLHIESIIKQAQSFVKWKQLFLLTTFSRVESAGVINNNNWLPLEQNSRPKNLF